ncbi:MAG: hypothetical protein R2848_12140 [Thermomicrobiales bacterium]
MATHDDSMLSPAALGRLWDATNRQIAPVGGRTGAASIAAAETIRRLGERDDAPHLTATQSDAIWASVAAVTMPGVAAAAQSSMEHSNTAARYQWRLLALLQSVIRQTTIGALAGFLVGILVVGGAARILMRIAAMLSPAQLDGALTENGNRVGEMTIGGTFELMFFGGAMPGLIGGIAVMAIRPWLPDAGWRRYLGAGAIGFAVAGPLVLERGENADYERFGILGVNVCLFTLLPFLFGVAVVPVIDEFDRRMSSHVPSFRRGPGTALASLSMLVFVFPLIVLVISGLHLQPMGMLLLLPAIRVLAPFWARNAPTLTERHRRELRGARLGYAALAVPCLLGIVLMVQSVMHLIQ